MFFGLVLLLLSGDKRIENNSYEDYVRELLGKDAYLLFVFDKAIMNVSVTIQNLNLIYRH